MATALVVVPVPMLVDALLLLLMLVAPLTVRQLSVPTLVSEDAVTPEASVVPVSPLAGAEVAAIVPLPEVASDAPVLTTIAAVVLVPVPTRSKVDGPVAPVAPVSPVAPVAP